jgi:hypothetical protein
MSSIGHAVARVHIGQAPAEGGLVPIQVLSRAPVTPAGRKVARVAAPAAAALLWVGAVLAALAGDSGSGLAGTMGLTGGFLLAAALVWASGTAALCSVKWGGRRSARAMWTLAGSATGVAVASMTAALPLTRVGR